MLRLGRKAKQARLDERDISVNEGIVNSPKGSYSVKSWDVGEELLAKYGL